MRHGVKKIKFRNGKDANDMLMLKLVVNFLEKGKLTTTKTKAKALVSYLEKILTKTKNESEANKNVLLKKLGNRQLIDRLFKEIGPFLKEKTSGYVKMTNLGLRMSDGAELVKIEWTVPVVLETPKKPTKEKVEKKVEKDGETK